MSFSQELKDFVASTNAGMKLGNDAQENAAKSKYYAANEAYYNSKIPEDPSGTVAAYSQEGRDRFAPGGQGVPSAVPVTVTPDKYDPTKAPTYLADVSKKYSGLPTDYLSRTAWLENRFQPTGGNPNSTAGGLFQFNNDTASRYGLKDKNDPLASTDAAARYAVDNSKELSQGLGRNPTGAELYLAHQQGAGGAQALLRNPNASAVDALVPLYKGNRELALQAVVNNGGKPDMTAKDFANIWLNKYDSLVPHAAVGGMVQHYAEGGAVEAQKPYYATDLMSDVGKALDGLGEAVRGGFQYISDKFGLHERPAVADADPDYMKRVEGFLRDPGVDPAQVGELRRSVDPENQLGDALGTIYGMMKAYEHYRSIGKGDVANKLAGDIMLYTRQKSQQLGALAVHALQNGDQTAAVKAIEHAYNIQPNGNKIEMRDGKAILIDQKSGNVIREVDFTPGTLLNAAYGFSNGDAFLNDAQEIMVSEKEKVAAINKEGRVEAAALGANAKTDVAGINKDSHLEGIDKQQEGANNRDAADNKRAVDVATIGATSREAVADTNKSSHLEGIDKQQEGANQRNTADNQRAIDVVNTQQGGANYRAGLVTETSRENNQNTNATNERIATGRNETAVETTKIKDAGATERNALTNTTKAQTTIDTLDAKKSEGAANRASREGIASDRITSAEKQTGQRIDSREKITGDKLASQEKQTTEKVAASNQRAANRVASQEKINANNNATSRANTQDKIDATAANSAVKIDADKQKVDAANQEADRRLGAKGAATRQGSQLTRLDKMTDHAILGVDETTTPTVSAGQAQATRNIARGIVEAGGSKIAGDEAASYARQMTKWDPVAKRPKVQVKLNPADNTVTMPDGVTIPLSESAFKEVARIHGGAR